MLRGWGIRIVCGLAALAACLALAESASAGKKTVRFLEVEIEAPASNGYSFGLEAFRTQPGGAIATISFERDYGSALYILRRPAIVTKRRLEADFGEIGAIDLRFKPEFGGKPRGRGRGCERQRFSYGRFKGGLRIEGESGYSRVQQGASHGTVTSFVHRGRCRQEDGVEVVGERAVGSETVNQILGSCGGSSGAGFVAARTFFDGQSFFAATKASRTRDLHVIRTVYAEGAARRFRVDDRSAKARPPEPFEGHAEYRGGALKGNLRAPLPGAGVVDLTPGDAYLQDIRSFELPACFSPYFAVNGAERASTRNAVAASLQRIALTSAARRLFAALGSR